MGKGPAKEFHNRGFLNPNTGLASFEYKVEWYHNNFAYANVAIRDCNRQIDLNFDFTSEEEKQDRLFKIDTLIQQLQQFRREVFNLADQT